MNTQALTELSELGISSNDQRYVNKLSTLITNSTITAERFLDSTFVPPQVPMEPNSYWDLVVLTSPYPTITAQEFNYDNPSQIETSLLNDELVRRIKLETIETKTCSNNNPTIIQVTLDAAGVDIARETLRGCGLHVLCNTKFDSSTLRQKYKFTKLDSIAEHELYVYYNGKSLIDNAIMLLVESINEDVVTYVAKVKPTHFRRIVLSN